MAAIGAGAMGEVYRARDTRLDRTVALKYPPAAAQGFAEGTDERFLLNFPASSEDEASARPRIVVVQNWIEELQRLVPAR